MRDEYWLDACDNATIVIEKVTLATVIIEPAIEDSIPREPSAPVPNVFYWWISLQLATKQPFDN